MIINIHIDKVMIDSSIAESNQTNSIKNAIQTEIKKQLLKQSGTPFRQSPKPYKKLSTKPISIKPNSSPKQVGTKIGNAVYSCFASKK
ncbi:hypothetical protein [Aliikangiella sp. IMCC44359]|uniref:hypothetical protein n=1 Tax=Aliikangiella sp. IMCC44359 TaxID=3459125 RepID=UPI00403A86C3